MMNNVLQSLNKNRILTGIIVILVIVLAFVLIGNKAGGTEKDSGYSVVYMTTGEVYVGKLKTFPNMVLTDGYLLQSVKDPTDPNKVGFQIQPLSQAPWAPEYLKLNDKNIIFYGPILASSNIGKSLAAQQTK